MNKTKTISASEVLKKPLPTSEVNEAVESYANHTEVKNERGGIRSVDRQAYMNLVATLIPTMLASELKQNMIVSDGNELDKAAEHVYDVSYSLLYNAGKYFERELAKD